MTQRFSGAQWLAASTICVTFCSPARAQGGPAEQAKATQNAGELTEIIVTARRVGERLQDVPISVAVFDQQQLQNRNIIGATDLATYTPSLSANTLFGQDNTRFALRGFTQDIDTAPSVGVYFADVVAPRGGSTGLTSGDGAGPGYYFDLQNVQVLRGPQGTLFGRNTTGGAILFVPQKPTSELEGYIEGSYGNYDMNRAQGALNIPLADSIRVRFAVDHQEREGYLTNTPASQGGFGPSRFGDLDYTAARASLVADLPHDVEAYIVASYTHSSDNGAFQKIIAADPAFSLGALASLQLNGIPALHVPPTQGPGFYDVSQTYTDPVSRLTQWQLVDTTTWLANDRLTVKNIISYAQFQQDLRSPIFGTNFYSPALLQMFGQTAGLNFTGFHPLPGGHSADQDTFTEELQAQGQALDNRLTFQIGAYLEISNPLSKIGSRSPLLLSCGDAANLQCLDILGGPVGAPAGFVNYLVGETRYRDKGLYSQATYKLTEHLKLTGGLRYTWDTSSNTSQQLGYGGFPPFIATTNPDNPGTPGRAFTTGGPSFIYCTFADASNAAAINATPSTSIANFNLGSDCIRRFDQKSSAPTGVIDLEYTPIDDILLYGKYSRGYRAGTISPNISSQFAVIKPEKVDAYELGLKSALAGPVRATVNVAAFYNVLHNQQTTLGFTQNPLSPIKVSSTSAPLNLDESRIWGAEVDANVIPFTGLTLEVGYAYLNTDVTKVPTYLIDANSPYVLSGLPKAGEPLLLSPKNKATITGTYALPLDETLGRISLGATFTYVSSQLSSFNNQYYAGSAASDPQVIAKLRGLQTLPSYKLINLNANWDAIGSSRVDLSLFVTNLANEKVLLATSGLAPSAGFETASVGVPRMFGARLRYSFGN